MKVRATTIEKYFRAMESIKTTLQFNPSARPKDICASFKVSASIPSILRDLGVIERTNTGDGVQWRWIGENPSPKLAARVAQKLHENCSVNKPKEPEKQAPLELEARPVAQMPIALLQRLIAEQQKTNALLEEMAQRRRASA